MGQLHFVLNMTKKEFLNPHKFGEGMKLREFGSGHHGTLTALALLLAENGSGGIADFHIKEQVGTRVVGRWARDSILILGDQGQLYPWVSGQRSKSDFVDISDTVIDAMAEDAELCRSLATRGFYASSERCHALHRARARAAKHTLEQL